MNGIRNFLAMFGSAGLLPAVLLVLYVFQAILYGISPDLFQSLSLQLVLPTHGASFLSQPWSYLTYWTVFSLQNPLFFLFNLLFIFFFGKIFRDTVGEQKLRGLLAFALTLGPLPMILLGLATPADWGIGYLMGDFILVYILVGAVITLLPRYPIRYFLVEIPILYLGLFFIVLNSALAGFWRTEIGLSIPLSALMGFGFVKALQSGVNLGGWISFSWLKKTQIPKKNKPAFAHIKGPLSSPKNEQEELDKLLDKVLEVGYDKLTRTEKERLEVLSGKSSTGPKGPGQAKND